ncbi:hypothetical protein [Intrasporangium sp.]|uniref:hypothetical protein n=1 Tax=Intrasporangium sp. TaxID=1925024 RepID=UPI003221BF12
MTTAQQNSQAEQMARRRTIRYLAAGFAGAVAILYVVLMLMVRSAELKPGVTDRRTYGGYLVLAIAYAVGAVILATIDNQVLHVLGMGVQAVTILLFIVFGVGLLGPGVFRYQAISHLPLGLWAALITGAQVLLLAMLGYLADQRRHPLAA